ncbi:sensory box histidine kinase/response regulator [Legionella santicrucis]|uniref:histidine kinase n=1 Tax=Legionella santicrucis TaxID=45074 RepID=A0A0W0Y9D8_9GAMM|nr:PAS domain-containing hybrid sensor histidine kinase/response regulator [Legionella santicrucis]KTD53577.1 sensory box histidine kinase/response regulator [Legionella santicrucis]
MRITQEELPVMAKAYDIASCSLIVIDRFMNVVLVNRCAKKILNIKASSWIGKPLLSVWEEARLPPIFDKNMNLICHKIMIINKYYRVWSKVRVIIDNKTHWFLLDKDISEVDDTYITLEHEIEKMTGHVFEKHLPVNQYVDEIRHFLSSMINRIPCYVYWKNKDLEYVGCNEMAAEFFSLKSSDDIIGKTDFDLFSDKVIAESYREVDKEILQHGKPVLKLPQILVRHNGEIFHTLVSKVPITSENGSTVGVLGITIDITKEKQAEIAKTEFIANMSHDIRTPLTGVIGLSEILEKNLTNPLHKEEAHLLYESGNQLLTMLNEILEDVRAGSANEMDIHEETFELRQCIDDLIKLEAPTIATKNLTFTCTIDPNVPQFIVSDRKKIHHILLNLLGNAVKFTQVGGITLTVKPLSFTAFHTLLHFSVSDTGIGIPEMQKDKVFEQFFRVNPSYEGNQMGYGLGLHIVQSYVTLLGGHLTLESKEEEGTTISFDLSCRIGFKENLISNDKSNESYVNQNNESQGTVLLPSHFYGNPLHLLLVEDNPIALKVLESFVTREGYRFTSVTDANKALECIKSTHFDLIITDIGLSEISGIELVKQIRHWEKINNFSLVPIVGLTGHALETARVECIHAGMNEVFRKPINIEILRDIVKQCHLNKQVSSEEITVNQSSQPSISSIGFEHLVTEELLSLDSVSLFDTQEGMRYINDVSLLFQLLKEFTSPTIQQDIQNMKKAYLEQDWNQISHLTHKIKGGVACIGTKRMFLACQYLEQYSKAGNQVMRDKLYHQVIEVNQQTFDEVTRWLKKYR